MSGWRTEGQLPSFPKFVLVAAPHTSNLDLPYALFVIFVLRAKIYWLGKDAVFRMPFKRFFTWIGGLPVDRTQSSDTVSQLIKMFHENERLILAIAPAGTRKRVEKWKTGFYHAAMGANVPMVLGFLDYRRRVGGIGPVVWPTGDFESDMKTIRTFYDGITAKHPKQSLEPLDM